MAASPSKPAPPTVRSSPPWTRPGICSTSTRSPLESGLQLLQPVHRRLRLTRGGALVFVPAGTGRQERVQGDQAVGDPDPGLHEAWIRFAGPEVVRFRIDVGLAGP